MVGCLGNNSFEEFLGRLDCVRFFVRIESVRRLSLTCSIAEVRLGLLDPWVEEMWG